MLGNLSCALGIAQTKWFDCIVYNIGKLIGEWFFHFPFPNEFRLTQKYKFIYYRLKEINKTSIYIICLWSTSTNLLNPSTPSSISPNIHIGVFQVFIR